MSLSKTDPPGDRSPSPVNGRGASYVASAPNIRNAPSTRASNGCP